jgi:hypothetical protein
LRDAQELASSCRGAGGRHVVRIPCFTLAIIRFWAERITQILMK